MSKINKCKGCKRAIGNLAEKTDGYCPRCQNDEPKMVDASEEEDDNKEQT
jgi:hypothetical protein